MMSFDLHSQIINWTTLQYSCLSCILLPNFSVLNKMYPTYGDFKLSWSKQNQAVTALSEGDVWNETVCVDDLSSMLSTVQGVLWGFFGVDFLVWSCTHLLVYFHVKRILIWCFKTAPQHQTKHSLSKHQPGVNNNVDIPGYSWFSWIL